jgi:hypothetical protein
MIRPQDIRRAIGPLRLVFWGGLIWLIDIKINGFDLLNDLLGAILLAIGVAKLARFQISDRYLRIMWGVKLVAVLSIPVVIMKMIGLAAPWLMFLLSLFGVIQLAAIVAFCVCMRWLCLDAGMMRSAQSWRMTLILIVVLLAGPFALFLVVGMIMTLGRGSWHIRLEAPMALLLLAIVIIPIIHLFISTSRMKREAIMAQTDEENGGRGFPGTPSDLEP